MVDNIKLGYNKIEPYYGFYIEKIPQEIFSLLHSKVNYLQNNFSQGYKMNDRLAGQIKNEFEIVLQPELFLYIKDLVTKIETNSNYILNSFKTPITKVVLSEMWINFQKKYEYNPLHTHFGIYSYVIWYQVPYTKEEEATKYGYKSNIASDTNGEFHFLHYFPDTNQITQIPLSIDKSMEGHIAIFPSKLHHSVYPFYSSDDYRITISGNIVDPNNMDNNSIFPMIGKNK